jgi:hypothetical protein
MTKLELLNAMWYLDDSGHTGSGVVEAKGQRQLRVAAETGDTDAGAKKGMYLPYRLVTQHT